MPTTISNQTYYRTKELCQMVGISRSTLLRWFQKGTISDASRRDRRGWRLFTEAAMKEIKEVSNKIQ